MANRNILLIEPGYKNKYPPLGLMKIAQYHGPNGKKDNVRFIKGEGDKSVLKISWDRIYVTSLFTFEWNAIARSIDFAIQLSNNQPNKVFVGGIAASLMHEDYIKEPKWTGVRFISGLLSESPAASLQLDDFIEELYSDDQYSTPIEDLIPDYSILDQINEQYIYPVHDAYFAYASRGCVRKCSFCGVPKLEGDQRDAKPISHIVNEVERLYGTKRDLTLMDNNIVASPNFKSIITEIRDLGFTRGATIIRNGRPIQRRVDFNQGVDARILSKDKMFLREMSTICLKPLRIAFDHIGVRKPYETSIRYANEFGLKDLSNYMLYNFNDTPQDLYQRMRINIDLNNELNIRIFSFPMRYQPTNLPDRSHIGENWSRFYLRSMQIILQATHGIVSGNPEFFEHAFGGSEEKYKALLLMPHHFLFNREWYEKFGGKLELEDYQSEFNKLTLGEKDELNEFLSSHDRSRYKEAANQVKSAKMRSILHYYLPIDKDKEMEIWEITREQRKKTKQDALNQVPEDERVEDADLEDAA